MKKYPDDALPSVAIQFVCFTVLFVVWTLGDVGWKHGASGVALLPSCKPFFFFWCHTCS